MGGLGGGGDGSISNVNTGVSASSRKVVQSLKEIVNCSDLEIYAMLVECDMDPDETVNRLLSQDTFHEVKSKRDKKKNTKIPAESWTCSTPNRGARSSGNDSYNTARDGGNRYNSNELGSVQGVPANRRENRTRNHWAVSSSSSSGVLGHQPPSNSDPTDVEVKKAPMGSSDAITSSSLPSPAYQSAWANANPGQRTMADIVKMGRPLYQKNVTASRSLETQESGIKAPLKDEWPSIEKQDPSSSLVKPFAESNISTDQFSESQHLNKTHWDDENPIASPPNAEQVLPPASVSSRNLVDGDSRESSVYDDESNNMERHAFEENGGEDVPASVATGFQQLTIDNDEEHETSPKDDKPAVIIPNHLQVNTSECSHLMFGSFSSRIGSGQTSGLNETLEETQDESSFRHPDTNYYGEEEGQQLMNVTTEKEQTSYQIDSTYKFSPPADYGFENMQQLNPPSETNPQMQNLDAFPNVMQQGYTSSLPNNLLPSGIQDTRDQPDIHYSPFQTKYNTTTPSSLSGPAISMAEALRTASMSSQNAMPGAGQQAAALAQHLALNPYAHQPGMPVGHYGNLISYPFMPQSYNPYMPLAFQQAFPTGNHQTLAAMHLQYKNQATAPPIPPPSAYRFGGGAPSSNNFPLTPTTSANSYEDVLSSQFKDRNHLALSLQQQNENSAAWHQGQQSNSRVVPGSGYYSFPGHQSQQPPGFRQAQQLQQQQQPSQQQQQQHFGGHGYASPYHSQAAMSLEHLHHQHQHQQQQQNARDASKQTQQQLWPNNY
ncbi:protein kinase 4 [Eutrema salsugineum]|uniref:protein kinase 4 n=1 Tax=Eutrema salsugineum TaxID=72664 RepID=UPI000CED2A07|nr:protein kinase 4 [Eutrema salsugineum]